MTAVEPRGRSVILVGGLVALLAIALPAAAADPSPHGGDEQRPGGRDKSDKGPELPVTLRGSVEPAADAGGRPTFTMTVDGTTWELSAGPTWYHGDGNPLAAFAGRPVEVAGTHREGDLELDVETVDGQPIRAPGRPPWAGGPWVVGEAHPGWKDWMADRERGHGREHAPGQQRDEAGADE